MKPIQLRVEPYLGILGLLLLWWLVTDALQLLSPDVLASPVEIVQAIVDLAISPFAGETLIGHVFASLSRWLVGILIGCAIGVPLGIFMAWNRTFEAVVNPIFEVFRYIPPFAWVPLAIVWLGTSLSSQAAVVAIAALPSALLNSHRAVMQIDSIIPNAASVLGSSPHQTLRYVILPTAAPGVLTGVRLAFSNGWMALVGAELVGATSGLGYLIDRAQTNLTIDVVMAGMVVIGLVGVVADILLRRVTARTTNWSIAGRETK